MITNKILNVKSILFVLCLFCFNTNSYSQKFTHTKGTFEKTGNSWVEKTKWGGLVGVHGFPEFIDGGVFPTPHLTFFNEKDFGIENVGTPPDVEVDQ